MEKLEKTFILVTHDQDEALVVSDRIAVMKEGEIIQFGTPEEVYDFPQNKFVAQFLGAANLFPGQFHDGLFHTDIGSFELEETPPWDKGMIVIRPEWIRISDTEYTSEKAYINKINKKPLKKYLRMSFPCRRYCKY